jgi:hypothetical protein
MNTSRIDILATAAATAPPKPDAPEPHEPKNFTMKGTSFVAQPSATAADTSLQHCDASNLPLAMHNSNFVAALHAILSDRSAESIITWLPCGKSFVILDRTEFASKILPKYMRQAQFHSFLRRLQRWGFKRVYGMSTSHLVYYHNLFQKNRFDLIQSMKQYNAKIAKTDQDQIVKGADIKMKQQCNANAKIANKDQDRTVKVSDAKMNQQVVRCSNVRIPQVNYMPVATSRPVVNFLPSANMTLRQMEYAGNMANQQRNEHNWQTVDHSTVIIPQVNYGPVATSLSVMNPSPSANMALRQMLLQGYTPVAMSPAFHVNNLMHPAGIVNFGPRGNAMNANTFVPRRMPPARMIDGDARSQVKIDQVISKLEEELMLRKSLKRLGEQVHKRRG